MVCLGFWEEMINVFMYFLFAISNMLRIAEVEVLMPHTRMQLVVIVAAVAAVDIINYNLGIRDEKLNTVIH